jgi:hypothetical protein
MSDGREKERADLSLSNTVGTLQCAAQCALRDLEGIETQRNEDAPPVGSATPSAAAAGSSATLDSCAPNIPFSAATTAAEQEVLAHSLSTASSSLRSRAIFMFLHPLQDRVLSSAFVLDSLVKRHRSGRASDVANTSSSCTRERRCSPT